MKFSQSDVLKLRNAFNACQVANITSAVFANGKMMALGDGKQSVIFSDFVLESNSDVDIGVMRINELSKRLSLFKDDAIFDLDVNDQKKALKFLIRGQQSKIEFRCSDTRLIRHPKTSSDEPIGSFLLKREEIGQFVKGIKALGAEQMSLQIKRDGSLRVEAVDDQGDRFDMDLSTVFDHDAEIDISHVVPYAVQGGVLFPLLEASTRNDEQVSVTFMQSNQLRIKLYGVDVYVMPKILYS